MKLIGFLTILVWTFGAMAQDYMTCKFYLDGNDTGIKKLRKSEYTTTFGLSDGQVHEEQIKLRRLLLVHDEEDLDEQKKLAFEDVIFLFEKDKRDQKIDWADEDILNTASSTVNEPLIMIAQRNGSNINLKLSSKSGKNFNMNFNGYGNGNDPLKVFTGRLKDIDGRNETVVTLRPSITVNYKKYHTPVFGKNKMKKHRKHISIGFTCKKESKDQVSNTELNKDLSGEEAALEGVLGGNASSR
jgi:hypothetical protein